MRKLIRVLSFVALLGGAFWIWSAPREVEPYVTSVTLLIAFLATFSVAKGDSESEEPEPDVILYFIETGHLQHQLVVENRSDASAFEVDLELHYRENQSSPFVQGEDTFPIKELYGLDERQVLVGLGFDTGVEFDATWIWKNSAGRKFERSNTITLRR